MGVDYDYCGECRECLHEDEFPICGNCEYEYDHKCGHGRYCIDCGLKKKIFIEIDEMYFCNKKCYKIFKKENDQEIIDEQKVKQDRELTLLKKIIIN